MLGPILFQQALFKWDDMIGKKCFAGIILIIGVRYFYRVPDKVTYDHYPVDDSVTSDNFNDYHLVEDTATATSDTFNDKETSIYMWNPWRKFLPSTSTRPYNSIDYGSRYFMYTPSGGLNNQALELINSINVAKFLNRTTVVVPQAAAHSNFRQGYLTSEDLIPMDVLYDFQKIELLSGLRFVALNETIDKFLKRVDDVAIIDTEKTYTHQNKAIYLKKAMEHPDSRLVYFSGSFFNYWFPSPKRFAEGFYLHHTNFIKDLGRKCVENKFKDGAFNAMHIRRGDFKDRAGSSSIAFVKRAQILGWSKNVPVYIATNEKGPRRSSFMSPLLDYFETVLFLADMESYSLPVKHASDFWGVIEQEICARAGRFLGTLQSTFSLRIHKLRIGDHEYMPQVHLSRYSPSDSIGEHMKKEVRDTSQDVRKRLFTWLNPENVESTAPRPIRVAFDELV